MSNVPKSPKALKIPKLPKIKKSLLTVPDFHIPDDEDDWYDLAKGANLQKKTIHDLELKEMGPARI